MNAARLVEARHQIPALKLVDSRAEQAQLEEILDEASPPSPPTAGSSTIRWSPGPARGGAWRMLYPDD